LGVPRLLSVLALLVVVSFSPGTAAHPLDPLSGDEINTAVSVLEEAGDSDLATQFALIGLSEPDKKDVLAWQPGQPVIRRAFIVARRDRMVFEGIVNIGDRRVERWQAIPRVQSRVLPSEWQGAQRITTSDPGWQAAMRGRGYDPARLSVFCAPLPAGYFAVPVEEGRRLLKVTCFDTTGTRNVWSRPIEGLVAVVDLDAHRVVRLIDNGVVPLSPGQETSDTSTVPASRPTQTSPTSDAPLANFVVDGNAVHWHRWSLHFGMDPRTGLVVSVVRYEDQGRQRMVLYRGSLAEIFVPYMDPDPAWSFRSYMDVGEFGIGLLSLPLMPGSDCPAKARFLDATIADEHGRPVERRGVVCLFERDTDAPLWRHAEIANGDYQARPDVELVMRTIPTLGNYDYIIDWVLTETGTIRIDVGATGLLQVKGVRARRMADPSAGHDTAYGTLIAPNLVGVDHDHFLSFRLDVDIDGQRNTLMRRRLVPERLTGAGGRRSLWRVVEEPVIAEGAIHGSGEPFRIENPNLANALGQHPGYELRLGHEAMSMLAPDDFPQRRAGFSAAPLWITAYDPNQLYAAGRYPNQSHGGDGLPAYVARHRPVANADIVLWCSVGFHHVPRSEDWPIMPTMWHSVSLVPDGFFDRSLAADLPSRWNQ
jgi:primary-amine oxidase